MMPELSIVTVAYNSAEVIGRMLESLDMPGVPVFVVDNGSTDGTVSVVSKHPNVTLIPSENIGYGRGANLGFRRAETPYVLLVNPDVIFEPGALANMLDAMKNHPEIGILGAQVCMVKWEGDEDHGPKREYDADGLCPVDWIVGALMLMRRDVFMKLGGFDEKIFLFYEETDLCRRYLQAGYKLALTNRAKAKHYAGKSTPPSLHVMKIKSWHAAWSKAYYHHKHFSRLKYVRKCFTTLLKNLVRLGRSALCLNRQDMTKYWYELRGFAAYLSGAEAFCGNAGRLT